MPPKYNSESAKLILEKYGLKPLEPYVNFSHKWKSECVKCGDLNLRPLKSVLKHKKGCVFCSGKRVNPEKAASYMISQGMKPLEPFKGSSIKWKCECMKCHRTIFPTYKSASSKRRKSGCAFCARTKVDVSEILEVMKNFNLKPLEPYRNAMTKWKCKCLKCGETVYPMWATIQNQGSKCKYCSGNSITEQRAVKIMKRAGYLPLEPYKDSKTKWKAKHLKCGSIVSPKFNSIASGIGGCRNCAIIGFEVKKPAFVYLLHHKGLDSLKVGIGNRDSKPNRINVHKRHGWELIFIQQFEVGWDALNVETAFFTWLRKEKGIPPHLSIQEMPQSGWAETFSLDRISTVDAKRKLTSVIRSI